VAADLSREGTIKVTYAGQDVQTPFDWQGTASDELGRKLPIGGRRHNGSLNTATASGLIKREIK
jgi:hypothetical protein